MSDIRPGDKVKRRDTDSEEGKVLDVLPFWGAMEGGPETFLFDVAVVKRGRRKTVERVADLIKLTEGNDQQ